MSFFVGAEYVIANALIQLKQKGQNFVTFAFLRRLGWQIQQVCNNTGINAIILTSGYYIKDAVYDFSDYFEYVLDANQGPLICIKKDTPIEDLKDRFIYCLPDDIAKVIIDKTSDLVA